MSRLSEKVAIVTGASKGIGAGIATALGAAGARVAVNYSSDREGAERVVRAITDKGGEAIAVGADVSKVEASLSCQARQMFLTCGGKRAIIATARKLAVPLHHLWMSGEDYQTAAT
jgi:NAD(P)-dependent dehydrogenase (short-subunit alcohol dehydrogenase family)